MAHLPKGILSARPQEHEFTYNQLQAQLSQSYLSKQLVYMPSFLQNLRVYLQMNKANETNRTHNTNNEWFMMQERENARKQRR